MHSLVHRQNGWRKGVRIELYSAGYPGLSGILSNCLQAPNTQVLQVDTSPTLPLHIDRLLTGTPSPRKQLDEGIYAINTGHERRIYPNSQFTSPNVGKQSYLAILHLYSSISVISACSHVFHILST